MLKRSYQFKNLNKIIPVFSFKLDDLISFVEETALERYETKF